MFTSPSCKKVVDGGVNDVEWIDPEAKWQNGHEAAWGIYYTR